MKGNLYIVIILTALLSACGGSDIDTKKKELAEAKEQAKVLAEKIKTLEGEIAAVEGTPAEEHHNAVLVNFSVVKPDSFSHTIDVRGNVASRTNVGLSAETAGRIVAVQVAEGTRVTRGTVLVRLDNEILKNNVAEVKTALELAEAVFERQSALWDKKIGTEIQYLEAKNRKESLERQLATLQSQLDKTIIRAPFNGNIDAVPARVGEMAQPGMPLVRMVNPDEMFLEADISERFIGKFKKGDKVSVYFPIQDKTVESQISALSEVINVENRTFRAEFRLPASPGFTLKPNQVVVITLVDYASDDSIIVPTELILTDASGKFIYTLLNEDEQLKATKSRVSVGITSNGRTEVTEGLAPGDKVVMEGYRDLTEGAIVQSAENPAETAKL